MEPVGATAAAEVDGKGTLQSKGRPPLRAKTVPIRIRRMDRRGDPVTVAPKRGTIGP